MSAATVRFDHPGLTVADLDASCAFYGAALGFEPQLEFALGDVRGAMLDHPTGMRLELFEVPGSAPGREGQPPLEAMRTRGLGHVAFAAPDIDELFAQVLAAGAREVLAPQPSPEPGVRFAFLADPEGHLIELVER
jgi:lactoylglutathione lyase